MDMIVDSPKLNSNNIKEIDVFSESPRAAIIKEYLALQGVAIGDVLLRYRKTNGITSKVAEIITKACPVPTKYQVVHIDEFGMVWLKQISVRGGLSSLLVNPLTHAENWHYETDPRQIEASILDIPYDSRAEYKAFRLQYPGYGSKGKNEK